jgi:outer membrane receptor for ferrienterochelin and colicins
MKRALLGIGCAGLSLAAPALAQNRELEALMSQAIVSTPSKDAEASMTAPASSSIITAEDLRVHGLRSLNEALNYASLGMVTTTLEHAVEIGARGVLLSGDYGNHVLLLIDGVPSNEPWNGTAYFERGAGVPFELIDHIEVTLGPGSVMHGGQAMLGVINVVTKRARDYDGLHVIVEGDTTAPVSDDGRLRLSPLSGYAAGYRLAAGFGRAFQLAGLPAELTVQLERYRQDGPSWQLTPQLYGDDAVTGRPKDFGPRTPPGQWGGLTHNAGFTDAPAAYLKLRVGELEATARASMYTRSSPFMTSLVNIGDDFDDPDNRERDRFLQLGLAYRRTLSARLSLSARAYGLLNQYHWFSRRSAAEECPEGAQAGCERTLIGNGRSGGADTRLSIDEPELGGSTMLGVDARLRRAASELSVVDRITREKLPFANDYARTDGLVAPYLQQAVSPLHWLDINAGLRFDHDTRFGGKLSPRAALGVTPWRDGRIKAIYAEAFRAPTAYELNYTDVNQQIAAPSLKAETVRSMELSFDQQFGAHRVLFGVFRSTWSDIVVFRTLQPDELSAAIERGALAASTSEASVYDNRGRLKSFGYNAAYEGVFAQRLRVAANLTSAHSHVDEGDGSGSQPMTVGPTFFGNARVSYEAGGYWPIPALAMTYQARRPADRAFDGGFSKPPYAPPDLQLRLTFSGEVPQPRGLRYRLSGTYEAAAHGPYVVGPYLYAVDASTQAALSPQRRLSAFLGFEYVIR